MARNSEFEVQSVVDRDTQTAFIEKPFSIDAMVGAVNGLLGQLTS